VATHTGLRGVYLPTAAVVIEVVSPDDQTYLKIDFYASHRGRAGRDWAK
jgi:hypothetical protein